MDNKKLFNFCLFLLVLPLVNSITEIEKQQVRGNITLNFIAQNNCITDNSTYHRTGTITGTVEYDSSNLSCRFTGSLPRIIFSSDDHIAAMKDFTAIIYTNSTGGSGTQQLWFGKLLNIANGEWSIGRTAAGQLQSFFPDGGTMTTAINLVNNTFHTYTLVGNDTVNSRHQFQYYNSQEIGYYTDGAQGIPKLALAVRIGNDGSVVPGSFEGNIKSAILFNSSLTTTQIAWVISRLEAGDFLLNDSAAPPPPSSTGANITLTAIDYYDSTSINNFTVKLVGDNGIIFNLSTGNGTRYVTNVTEGFFNITFSSNQSGGYFSNTYNNINVSQNTFQGRLWQSVLYVNVTEIVTNNPITSITAKAPSQFNLSNSSGYATLYLKAGTYQISANSTGYLDWYKSETLLPREIRYANITLGKSNLTIKATSLSSGIQIINFSIEFTHKDIGVPYSIIQNTSNGSMVFRAIAGNFNMTFNSTEFSRATDDITIISTNIYPNYTFLPFTTNSINFSFFDEVLGKAGRINQTVSFDFVSTVFSTNYSTANGSLYIELVEPSEYRVSYVSNDYKKREYYFTLQNGTHRDFELYLLRINNGTLVTYTVNDQSGVPLQDAEIRLLRYYTDDNSYRIVAMAKTDIEGKAIIDTDFNNAFYQLIISRNGSSVITKGSKIYSNSVVITLNLMSNPLESIDMINKLVHSLNFNNATETFAYTFSDFYGIPRIGTLEVIKTTTTGSGKIVVCSNSTETASGTILCKYNTTQNTGMYISKGYINTGNAGNVVTDVYEIITGFQKSVKEKTGQSGLLLSVMLAGTFAGLGFINPAIAIVMFLVGLFAMFALGFTALTLMAYISIAIIGGIVIWKIRT